MPLGNNISFVKMNPLVSVIMPAYNAEKWIAEAIDSILNQTYENIELLIYDDGSTDDTKRIIIDMFKNRGSFISLGLFGDSVNRGVTHALNELIETSQGKYIARMDADDIAMPDRIEKQVNFLRNVLEVSAVGSAIELIGDENTNPEREIWWGNGYMYSGDIGAKIPYRNCLCHPSVMFRGDVLRKYMYKGNNAFQDYDLFLRMVSDGHKIGKNVNTLIKYRVHSDSEAAKNESDWAEIKLKLRFLWKKFPHWNKFDTHVMRSIWKIIRR